MDLVSTQPGNSLPGHASMNDFAVALLCHRRLAHSIASRGGAVAALIDGGSVIGGVLCRRRRDSLSCV